jgi:SAM-dependent methyltransferase
MADQRPSFLWAEEASARIDLNQDCPTCGDAAAKTAICFSVPGAVPPWCLLGCSACGCGFYDDQSIPDYGAPDLIGSIAYYLQQGMGVAMSAGVLARIQKPPGASYVEIGCGFGLALDMAVHAMGWVGRGMDPAAQAAVGRDLLGLDIDLAYFDPTTVADASCDIVMASEVLEHLPAPVPFLREIRRGLKADGVVVVTTPDVGALHPPIDKRALTATLSVGLHVILHSAASLEWALREAGFAHVRVESVEWQLIGFGSSAPLDLREDDEDTHQIVTRYLADRAQARIPLDDLYFGYAGRALFEAGRIMDWTTAERVWSKLDPALRERYGISVDEITAPPPGSEAAPFEDLATIMPFNLAPIMLARAYQRLAAGVSRSALRPRFAAIRAVCAPIWAALSRHNLGDGLTEQILWLAQTEEILCAAYAGCAEVVPMMSAVPESPRGVGLHALQARTVVTLMNMERPYLASVIARRAGLSHARRPGDLSLPNRMKAYLYEQSYRLRQMLRA